MVPKFSALSNFHASKHGNPLLSYNILKEVKKRKSNGRNEWENNSVKKEEGKIEKERKILKIYLIADVVSFSDEES